VPNTFGARTKGAAVPHRASVGVACGAAGLPGSSVRSRFNAEPGAVRTAIWKAPQPWYAGSGAASSCTAPKICPPLPNTFSARRTVTLCFNPFTLCCRTLPYVAVRLSAAVWSHLSLDVLVLDVA
jgi:hypothetical protein